MIKNGGYAFYKKVRFDVLYVIIKRALIVTNFIYGTPIMHKFSSSDIFLKLRPIICSIGTFDYDLSCFLCDLLSPVVRDDYSCKDAFSFVSQIKNANLSGEYLDCYDVTSLFTNIPL